MITYNTSRKLPNQSDVGSLYYHQQLFEAEESIREELRMILFRELENRGCVQARFEKTLYTGFVEGFLFIAEYAGEPI